MKILILANNDVGLYKFRKELIEELTAEGHDIIISLPDGDLVRPFEQMGCRFIDTPIDRRGVNPITDLKLLSKYKKIIKTTDPDLVITYTIKPNVYGGIAAKRAKKQYAVNITGLGTAFEKPGFIRTLVIALYKKALRKAKVVFCENSGLQDRLVSYGCCDINKTYVLNGAGVNTGYFAYQPYPENDKVQFLFIGRIMKEKGINELLAAMKRLIDDGEKCFLHVAGPCEEDYGQILSRCESEGWLEYHGYKEDVRPLIAACDCVVLPSYHEGMANTNLEGASTGRPVITSDIPGCKESVKDGESGLLCKPGDADSLYEKMKLMIRANNREEMGAAGRRLMIKEFDRKTVVEKTVKQLF
ncbi:MAG: glycosyltransferase family 4 protein [Clostridia bacterium]|nr:glycosyltransferase family 4 protein [Clostridia bacterium]